VKYIVKSTEPESFTTWKNSGDKVYSDLRNPVKSELKNALLLDQGHICCYCESKIRSNNSHIEHLDPQCNNNGNDLDFNNLLCSCQKQLSIGEPRHCGNSKANDNIDIHPLQNDCETKFKYTADGYIEGIDNDAQETIETLQLNIENLNNLRANAIEPFLIDSISEEERQTFVQDYLQVNNGHFNEFYTTIKYLFE